MIIAQRKLQIHPPGEAGIDIEVRLFAPVFIGPDWSCRFEIDWPESTRAMSIHGIDAMQALILALQVIGAELYTSRYHKDGTLAFLESGGGYGFPVSVGLRNLLIGDDKTDWAG
jgi:hypothetical protein